MMPTPGVMVALMPPGSGPLIDRASFANALVRVTVAEARVALSGSVMVTSVSAIATAVPFSV